MRPIFGKSHKMRDFARLHGFVAHDKCVWWSNLNSGYKVVQIDAFNFVIRPVSAWSNFCRTGLNLAMFGVIFSCVGCAARTVGENNS